MEISLLHFIKRTRFWSYPNRQSQCSAGTRPPRQAGGRCRDPAATEPSRCHLGPSTHSAEARPSTPEPPPRAINKAHQCSAISCRSLRPQTCVFTPPTPRTLPAAAPGEPPRRKNGTPKGAVTPT